MLESLLRLAVEHFEVLQGGKAALLVVQDGLREHRGGVPTAPPRRKGGNVEPETGSRQIVLPCEPVAKGRASLTWPNPGNGSPIPRTHP